MRVKEPSGFKEVKLDCAGNLANWQPVGKGDLYQMTNIDLIRLGVDSTILEVRAPAAGQELLTSVFGVAS